MPPVRPKVSIGLPVYNGSAFVAAALDGLLAQTMGDFELIVADNASTDDTEAICREYAARDPRIRYIRNKENVGVYRNCNAVMRLAAGEYFKLAAADDLCDPRLLSRCCDVLDANQAVVAAYAKTRFIDEHGAPLPIEDPGWHLTMESPVERLRYVIYSGHWLNVFFGLVRRRDLAQTRLFPLYPGGDCRLVGELALRGQIVEIPEYLFFRRIHAVASSQNRDPVWQARFFKPSSGLVLPVWQICLDHAGTIARSDLSAAQKRACLGMVLDRMVASKRTLLKELWSAAGVLAGRVGAWVTAAGPRREAAH
jgi:glycosyltransferase involved in cell wall biosynthesis